MTLLPCCTLQNVIQTQKCVLCREYAKPNRCVFKCFAKVSKPKEKDLKSTDKAFQLLGPATAKDLHHHLFLKHFQTFVHMKSIHISLNSGYKPRDKYLTWLAHYLRNKIQSSSIVFCGNVISPSESARNLCVTFDSSLSLTD